MIDLHNHVLPEVDDGASSPAETAAALDAFASAGVSTVVATPHFRASLLDRPAAAEELMARFDQAFQVASGIAAASHPGMTLYRGVELLLDSPSPDLADPSLRLGGTPFVLLEFPFFTVPPNVTRALDGIVRAGWLPVVAHPERYADLERIDQVLEWRDVGCHVQINHGSLLGRFGERATAIAWELLAKGWADFLASDYHARGRLATTEAAAALSDAGGEEAWHQLTTINPGRLLLGQRPLAVTPVRRQATGWRSIFRRHR